MTTRSPVGDLTTVRLLAGAEPPRLSDGGGDHEPAGREGQGRVDDDHRVGDRDERDREPAAQCESVIEVCGGGVATGPDETPREDHPSAANGQDHAEAVLGEQLQEGVVGKGIDRFCGSSARSVVS